MSSGDERRRALPGLVAIGLGASVAPLDFAVNVAFPAITAAFALPTQAIRWVAVCYVLAYGSLMLGFGALGDRIGHLRVFRAGLLLSAAAFVLCAVAPAYPWLLAARVVQGVGAALTLSCAPALATLLVDERQRTWALSGYASSAALAGIVAPVVGGASIALLGWPGVYWFRVPIAFGALGLLPLLARRLRPVAPNGSAPPAFDATGSALLALAVALLLLGPALAGTAAGLPGAIGVSFGGALLMAVFVRQQRRARVPFLPPDVARSGPFRLLNLSASVVQLASFTVPLIVPYYLLRGAGWSPVDSGLVLSVWAGGTLLGSALAARIVTRIGGGPAALAAAAMVVAGLAGIAAWPTEPHLPAMAACLLLQGAGLGLFQVAYTDRVVAALPAGSRGVAGSLTMVTRTVGLVLGATVWIWTLQAGDAAALAAGSDARTALMAGFGAVFRIAAGTTLVFFVLASLSRRTWFPGR